MAERKIEIVIKARDEASQVFQSVGQRLQATGLNLQKLGTYSMIAGGALAAGLGLAVREAMQSEAAISDLNNSLQAMGMFSKETSKELQDLAKALQRKTAYSDEEIMRAESLLATFHMTREEINQTIPRVLDLAAKFQLDLPQAAIMVGKAFGGMVTNLRRCGVLVDENAYKSKGFVAVLEEIDKEAKGAAEAVGNTGAGALAKFKNQLGEVAESVGRVLLPAITQLANFAAGLAAIFADLPRPIQSVLGVGGVIVAGALLAIGAISKIIIWVRSLRTAWLGVEAAATAATVAQTGASAAGIGGGAGRAIAGAGGAAAGAPWLAKALPWLATALPFLGKYVALPAAVAYGGAKLGYWAWERKELGPYRKAQEEVSEVQEEWARRRGYGSLAEFLERTRERQRAMTSQLKAERGRAEQLAALEGGYRKTFGMEQIMAAEQQRQTWELYQSQERERARQRYAEFRGLGGVTTTQPAPTTNLEKFIAQQIMIRRAELIPALREVERGAGIAGVGRAAGRKLGTYHYLLEFTSDKELDEKITQRLEELFNQIAAEKW